MDNLPSLHVSRRLVGKQAAPHKKQFVTYWERVGQTRRLRLPLPEDCLVLVAKYSACPPAIYHLCLTVPAFHRRPPQGTSLATVLLRHALNSSLTRVLQHHKIPSAAVSFAGLRGPGGCPSALLSGSTVVQVILGEIWKESDVDIFCTPSVAPAVRTKLVQNGFSLARLHQNYSDNGNGMTAFLLETNVHHVEGWAPTPADGSQLHPLDSDDESFSFTRSCTYGKSASRHFDDYLKPIIPLHIPKAHDQKICCLPGEPLSFDFRLKDTMDLVVAKSGCSDARELLKSFDMLICAAWYDGVTFHIPHPHLAFKRQTRMEPARFAMMHAFTQGWSKMEMPAYDADNYFFDRVLDSSWFISLRDVLDEAGIRLIRKEEDEFESSGRWYWNFLARLFLRQKKYAARGVTVVGAPPSFRRVASKIKVHDMPFAC